MGSYLITGGTGSLGRALTRRLLETGAASRVAVLSRDEVKHAEMQREFDDQRIRHFIGDIRDEERLKKAMRGVDVVIHAAAMKRIEACERDPEECEKTNIYGSRNVINAALESATVRRVILVSTDKAAAPYTAYGAAKMQAEAAFVSANNYRGADGPRFSVIRYGNVLGSRGSVIPLFRQMIDAGASHLPITDPQMTRFWITMDQAVAEITGCLARMTGGEIFVPHIPSARVIDIAAAMAPHLPAVTVGLRSYEKLHETLISVEQAPHTIRRGDGYVIEPRTQPFWEQPPGSMAPMPAGWSYASDTNDAWLNVSDLRRLLGVVEAVAA